MPTSTDPHADAFVFACGTAQHFQPSPGGYAAVISYGPLQRTFQGNARCTTARASRFERRRARRRGPNARPRLATTLPNGWTASKATADTTEARESTARLEGELGALRSRPWWRRLGARSP